jgi:hypothetical protein
MKPFPGLQLKIKIGGSIKLRISKKENKKVKRRKANVSSIKVCFG